MKKLLLAVVALSLVVLMLCSCAPAASNGADEAQEAEAPAVTIRTTDVISGSSDVVDPELQMSQEDIKALILDYLRGFSLGTDENGEEIWAYREMYQIATVSPEGYPGLSSVEFVLDPETMRLYASCEKGTEKVVHIPNNPNVSMYWYKQIPEDEYIPQVYDYFSSYGVQIKGTARLMEPGTEELYKAGDLYMRTLVGKDAWDSMSEEDQKARIDGICNACEWIEIIPIEYNVTSLWWSYNKENSVRPQHYDPDSPYYGYSPRQEYYVVD